MLGPALVDIARHPLRSTFVAGLLGLPAGVLTYGWGRYQAGDLWNEDGPLTGISEELLPVAVRGGVRYATVLPVVALVLLLLALLVRAALGVGAARAGVGVWPGAQAAVLATIGTGAAIAFGVLAAPLGEYNSSHAGAGLVLWVVAALLAAAVAGSVVARPSWTGRLWSRSSRS